jgi:uncharacterized phage-associated protein
MAVHVFDAAKRVCELGDWDVTNLKLQKILYLAQMVHLGRYSRRLLDETFEAWDYGPVSSRLYHKAKVFGAGAVGNLFHGSGPILDKQSDDLLVEACTNLLRKSPGELVAMTHDPKGAWAKNYRPDRLGIPIPDVDIVQEYRERVNARQ